MGGMPSIQGKIKAYGDFFLENQRGNTTKAHIVMNCVDKVRERNYITLEVAGGGGEGGFESLC